MKNKTISENELGIIGSESAHIDENSAGFQALKKAVQKRANNQTPLEKSRYELFKVRAEMQDYLNEKSSRETATGSFLRRACQATGVKQKELASYLGFDEANFSSLLNNRRNINPRQAAIFEEVFDIEAHLWLQVQAKNEIFKLQKSHKKEAAKYSLKGLLESTWAVKTVRE